MILTINQLEEIAKCTSPKRLELILPNLNYVLKKYSIINNCRIAHFVTQLLVESNFFRYVEDIESGERYEGLEIFGNNQKGDGRRYKGRGYFKLIGRTSYEAYSRYSGIDVVYNPHLILTPKIAMDVAGWIWDTRRINFPADEDSLAEVTKSVTGDYLVLREREDVLKHVKKILGI